MSRLTRLREALAARRWAEAEAIVDVDPSLAAGADGSGRGLAGFAAQDGRWEQARWLLDRGWPWLDALAGMMASADGGAGDEELGRRLWSQASSQERMPQARGEPLLAWALRSERFDWVWLVVAQKWPLGQSQWEACWALALRRHGELGAQAMLEGGGGEALLQGLQELGAQAAAEGALPALRWLAGRGLNVDGEDRQGRTPLCAAARGRRPQCVRWLVEFGAQADARDGQGRTPLWHAVARGDQECVQALLEAGADPEARQGARGQGDSPLRLARKAGAGPARQELCRALEAKALRSVAGAGARGGSRRL